MFENFKNTIDFYIRNKTKISRKNFVEKNPKLIQFIKTENKYVFEVLNTNFRKKNYDCPFVLDIGSKNWSYVNGLHKYFKNVYGEFVLDGIELDAYRLNANFYSRFEVAKYYMKNLSNVTYMADNLLNLNKKYDFITWFLPFVSKNPLIFWGLPLEYFCPEKLLLHAYNLLNENGQMLIVNQGENEAKIQENLLLKFNISYEYIGEIKDNYNLFKNKRFGFLIYK